MMPVAAPSMADQSHATALQQPVLECERASMRFLQLIPRDFAREHLIISQGALGDAERVLVSRRSDPAAIFNVGVSLQAGIIADIADDDERIARIIDDAYSNRVANDDSIALTNQWQSGSQDDRIGQLLAEADRDLLSTSGKGPVIRLVDALLFEALSRRSSDVHIQPQSDCTMVRYRIDGVLHTVRQLPQTLTAALVSRIKVMGRMDIAERRIPQDGRASVTIGDRCIDLRISTLPTNHGERAVVRLLDNSQSVCDFEQLGMSDEVRDRFLSRAGRTCGIILVTGPTGSGKTTTLYSTLCRVASSQINIMTIEDPIEYELSGLGLPISQSQVNAKKGVHFATGLRHILRQDPDVVMVGEIRDTETARIAIQSSLTGHLVLSTLHTNDAPSAVARLIDLGIEPYLVSASLSAVLAQRLVRLWHQPCSGRGCRDCLGSGFQGRIGIFELLIIDEAIRSLVGGGASLQELQHAARAAGMRTLQQEGEQLVSQRRTSALEIDRVLGADR